MKYDKKSKTTDYSDKESRHVFSSFPGNQKHSPEKMAKLAKARALGKRLGKESKKISYNKQYV